MDAGYSVKDVSVAVGSTTRLLGDKTPTENGSFKRFTYTGLVVLVCAVVALALGLAVVGSRSGGTQGSAGVQGTVHGSGR